MAELDDERLHAELDRQLTEVRATCDGLATRSGLLVAAISAAALILGPRVDPAHHESLLIVTAVALFVAAVCAVVTLVPGLKTGPDRSLLEKWMGRGPPGKTSKKLYTSKISILGGNVDRLNTMRNFFVVQGVATVIGVGLALWYAALRLGGVMTEAEGQSHRGTSPEDPGHPAFVARTGGHKRYIELQHSRSTESHHEPSVELDDSDYEEIREAIGRGTPTLLLGTSTRSLERNLAKVIAAQRAEPEPEPELQPSQVELAVKGSSASYSTLFVLMGVVLFIAFLIITAALGDATLWTRLAASLPILVGAPLLIYAIMHWMVRNVRVKIDDLPRIVRTMRGHSTIVINESSIGGSSEEKEKQPAEASGNNHA